MNTGVGNDDFNGNYCYMNSSTGSVINNHNLIDYKNKRNEFSTNRYLWKNNGLPDDVEIDYMSPAYPLNLYVNMEYNIESKNL